MCMSWPMELASTSDRFYFVIFLVRSHLFLLYFTLFLLPLSFPLLESLGQNKREMISKFAISFPIMQDEI